MQGHALTAAVGSWTNSPTSYAYQWRDCNGEGASCSDIVGATSSTYTLTSSDAFHTIDVLVTAANSAGASPPTASSGTTVPSWNASGATPMVLGSLSPSWQANYDGQTWGLSSNGCDNFYNDPGYTGWWGVDGSPANGYIPNELGSWSGTNKYFSFTDGSSASSPAFSQHAANLYVDSGASVGGEAAQRSNLYQCPVYPGTTPPLDQSASGAWQGANTWYRFEVYFPSDYVPEGTTAGFPHGSAFNWAIEWHNIPNIICCANLAGGIVTDTEDGGPQSDVGRFSWRILGGGDPTTPVPDTTNGAETNMGNPSVAALYPNGHVTWLEGPPLVKSHWYDVVVHAQWSYQASGSVQVWIDGKSIGQNMGSNLYYLADSTRTCCTSGVEGAVPLYVDNYRGTPSPASWNPDSIIHGMDMWGTSAASIGGGP